MVVTTAVGGAAARGYTRSVGKRSLEERFWEKVERGAPEACWPWLASRSHGYGRIIATKGAAPLYAHRVSYELEHGDIPPGSHVHHLCRNPGCVNPAHLAAIPAREHPALHDARRHHPPARPFREMPQPKVSGIPVVWIDGVEVDEEERDRILSMAREMRV